MITLLRCASNARIKSILSTLRVLFLICALCSEACVFDSYRTQTPTSNNLHLKTVVLSSPKPVTDPDFFRIQRAAKRGSVNAQYQLANKYHIGKGSPKDDNKSFYWFHRAAQRGNTAAQGKLGFMYEKGLGVQKNLKQAIKWYKLAAQKNDPLALHNLAYLYRNGIGVERNMSEAMNLYRQAASFGALPSVNSIGDMYYSGDGVKKDYKKAHDWYKKAANQGYALAFDRLGDLYRTGKGVKKNLDESLKYYQIASQRGIESALYKTNQLADENLKRKLLAGLKKEFQTAELSMPQKDSKKINNVQKSPTTQKKPAIKLAKTQTAEPEKSKKVKNKESTAVQHPTPKTISRSEKPNVNIAATMCFKSKPSNPTLSNLQALDKEIKHINSEHTLRFKINKFCSNPNIGLKQSNKHECVSSAKSAQECNIKLSKRYSKLFEQFSYKSFSIAKNNAQPDDPFQNALNSLNIPQGRRIIWFGEGDFTTQSKIPREDAYFNINKSVEHSLEPGSENESISIVHKSIPDKKRYDVTKQILPDVFGNPYIDTVDYDADKKEFNVTIASDSVDYKLESRLPATTGNSKDEKSYILNSSPWVVYEIKDDSIDLKGLFLRTHYSNRIFTPIITDGGKYSVPYGKLAYQEITSKREKQHQEKEQKNRQINQKMKSIVCQELKEQTDMKSKKAYTEFCK